MMKTINVHEDTLKKLNRLQKELKFKHCGNINIPQLINRLADEELERRNITPSL